MADPPSSPVLYQQAEIPGKGIGILATSPIPSGSLIIAEAPLFTIPSDFGGRFMAITRDLESYILTAISRLSKPQQKAFLSLHSAQAPELPPFLSIIATNSFALDTTIAGIFDLCSRFNHSCVPNAGYRWNKDAQKLEVRAHEEIQEGEEIVLSYLNDDMSRAARQESLLRRYRFQCQCPACGLVGPAAVADDQLRTEARRLAEAVRNCELMVSNPARLLKHYQDLINVRKRLKQTWGIPQVYHDAFLVCVVNGDLARAKVFIRLHIELRERIGYGHGVDAQMRELVEHPERFQHCRLVSRRWNTMAKHAREEGSKGFEEWLWMRAR
ncbi:hypothetical protein FN846DRAFT_608802 [Sphaerosporella brunnea]|uniref:SET domain-containing protein n=1 Tax=Sphaerosporella brunnea TaxID=1250544 RepID=A0A5J5EBI7_9PEZI|nr:hypothetical protein FN846DRAFT_608802 [Sphaerosporella brunnea]